MIGPDTLNTLEPRDRSRRARALARELSGSAARPRLRLGVLRHLDRHGACDPAEIPTGWPVTRDHVRGMLRWLVQDGLVERARDPLHGDPQVRLTHAGRRVLEEIDWDRAIGAA